MTAVSLPILFVGDADREEFREAAKSLFDRCAAMAADISAAQAKIAEGFAPALIVFGQSWPNQFSERGIDELRRAAPLARIVRLLGTWMDGEGRTGKPWPATLRANWQRWDPRPAMHVSSWSLPATASEDDRLLADAGRPVRTATASAATIGIHSPTRESAESLIDLCSPRGWTGVWLGKSDATSKSNIDCALFDARNASMNEIEALSGFRCLTGESPIIVLVGFPRLEDIQRFKSAGASEVVAKPFLADDLVRQIEQLLPAAAVR